MRIVAAGNGAGPLLPLAALCAGLAASLGLALTTSFLAFWGPHGHSYFLGGNSALAFTYELVPTVVSAGWVVLALHFRSRRRAVLLGLIAGLAGAALLIASWTTAIQFGVGSGLGLLAFAWAIAAPVLALILPLPAAGVRKSTPGRVGWYLVAAAVLLLAVTIPTFRLEQCGPRLGLPEAQRSFVVCLPGV